MQDNRDWVNHLIIAIGILGALIIIVGFVISLQPFLKHEGVENTVAVYVDKNANGTTVKVPIGQTMILELPESLYPQDTISVIDAPQGALVRVGSPTPRVPGNWTLELKALRAGYAQISVPSSSETTSDFFITALSE